jgi:hypothetical protein
MQLTAKPARVTRPLRSARITRHHRYYGAVRPCDPHRYSAPHGFSRLGVSLSRPGGQRPSERSAVSGHRFPRSMPEPGPNSRQLHAGHHLGSKQVSPRLIPGQPLLPGSDVTLRISTRHDWFALARLPGPHLTCSRHAFSATLTTSALYRRSLRWFGTSPCRAIPEGRFLHLWHSIASVEFDLLHRSLLLRSWHTRVLARSGRPHP